MAIKYFIVHDRDNDNPISNIDYILRVNIDTDMPFRYYVNIFNATCWGDDCIAEVEFLAYAYIKWDGCSHWYFYGEDYVEDGADSYYHLCGQGGFLEFIFGMLAGIKVGKQVLKDNKFSDDFDSKLYMKFESIFDENYMIEEISEEELYKISATEVITYIETEEIKE